jgi:putative transposase
VFSAPGPCHAPRHRSARPSASGAEVPHIVRPQTLCPGVHLGTCPHVTVLGSELNVVARSGKRYRPRRVQLINRVRRQHSELSRAHRVFAHSPVGRQNLSRAQIGDADVVLDLFRLLFTIVQTAARSHHELVLENLLLRHQLAVLTRPTRSRPQARLRLWDKLLWILARRFCAGWRGHLSFVTPETVVRWHWQGWRLFWRWKSRSRGGRPHLSPAVRDLIATMSRDNRLWGAERIRGELLKLGIVVSSRSIRRYCWRGPARSPSQTWGAFLRNHAHHLWAADLLSVPTLTFNTLHVLVFIAHCRRELVHVNVTSNPTAAWVWRQIIEATPWSRKPRHLLRDRDAVYGRDFRKRAGRIGIDAVATPIHAPKTNAIAERVIGTLRRECLDHLIVLDEQHLRTVLTEFVQYYNQERPDRTLGLQTPQLKARPTTGIVRSRPVLNGLHQVYERGA